MKRSFVGILFLAAAWVGGGLRAVDASSFPTNGLRVWLKGDAITNVADGGTVSNWVDSSGSGWNATNLTASSQPLFVTNGLNGKPVVRFDGLNDYLGRDNYTHGGDSGLMVVVVKRNGAPTSYHNILIQGGGVLRQFTQFHPVLAALCGRCDNH